VSAVLAALALAAAPGGPSFDCAKAASRAERLICADAELRGADLALAAAHAAAAKQMHFGGMGGALRDDQRAWLAERDACADHACLVASYRRRAAELARVAVVWGPYASVIVACDGRANTVTVEGGELALPGRPPVDVAKAPLDSGRFALSEVDRHADCRMADGRTVRLKIDSVPGPGFGECGAGSSVDLSLWVDEAPVVSRLEIADRCHRWDILDTLTLDAVSLRTCMTSSDADDPSGLTPPKCTTRPLAGLPREPDRIEYPASPGPPEGTIVTVYAADAALCRSMVLEKKDQLGQPVWEIAPPRGSRTRFFPETEVMTYHSGDHEFPGSIRLARFDADNDGTPDRVYWLYSEHSGSWADQYFVIGRGPALGREDLDEEKLRARSRLVFPDVWAKAGNAADADEETGYVVKHGTASGPLSIRFDRLTLKPFSVRGTTYFLADTSRDGGPARTEVVLRPRPTGAADEVCVFTYVVRHMGSRRRWLAARDQPAEQVGPQHGGSGQRDPDGGVDDRGLDVEPPGPEEPPIHVRAAGEHGEDRAVQARHVAAEQHGLEDVRVDVKGQHAQNGQVRVPPPSAAGRARGPHRHRHDDGRDGGDGDGHGRSRGRQRTHRSRSQGRALGQMGELGTVRGDPARHGQQLLAVVDGEHEGHDPEHPAQGGVLVPGGGPHHSSLSGRSGRRSALPPTAPWSKASVMRSSSPRENSTRPARCTASAAAESGDDPESAIETPVI
jgi:uncharacterized protein YecT (DUF1311 family)